MRFRLSTAQNRIWKIKITKTVVIFMVIGFVLIWTVVGARV